MTTTTEHKEQAALVDWAARAAKHTPGLNMLFSIPNGGKRSPACANYMVAEGLKAGVPDLCLAYPVAGYAGLFIEMKRSEGILPSKSQKKWIDRLRQAGYRAEVCGSFEAAKKIILEYLDTTDE